MSFKVACIQLNSKNNMQKNLDFAADLICDAASLGADFITLPENFALMADDSEMLKKNSFYQHEHPAIEQFVALAAKLRCYILLGSLAVKHEQNDKLCNRSILINTKGEIISLYDKIHLYDVTVEGGETHKESNNFNHGNKAVIAKLPWGKLGMTICYDLRFPNLYRRLALKGATIFTVPSAFTHFTGRAHWHILLRARAIENAAYVIAPAQCGYHPGGRRTFGHSIIIGPWGEILAEAGEGDEGFIIADIDLNKVMQVRQNLPSLKHGRDFEVGLVSLLLMARNLGK